MTYHLTFDLSFTQNAYPGRYFAFEGIDGSGKTTQVQKIAQYLETQGKKVVITKEPTESIVGMLIKKVIHGDITMPPMSLQYLFAADRGLHLQDVIIPSLKEGKVILSDRSFWSAVAYGIADIGLQENEKERLLVAYNVLSIYGGYVVPDKTFVINVPSEVAMQRVVDRKKEQTMYEKTATLSKVQQEYVWMAKKFGEYLKLIDGTESVENVFQQIVSSI